VGAEEDDCIVGRRGDCRPRPLMPRENLKAMVESLMVRLVEFELAAELPEHGREQLVSKDRLVARAESF
jgi:hypothetical protein